MSIQKLLGPILETMPQVPEHMQVEVLREIPTETLFLALKEADSQVILWFFENAIPTQVQSLIDIDCWKGDHFLPERFESYFKAFTLLHPLKVAEYTKGLDAEVLIRSLMEYCEVFDFDPQEPPDVQEEQMLITPDSRYVLILKTPRPDLREMLYLWLNKLSASDLELMRRTLESCKWEQPSDLEDFGYQMKKGRLEEMGFVDEHEARAIYAVGKAGELKKKLLQNPLPETTKRPKARGQDDDFGTRIATDFLPAILEKPLQSEGFFFDAFKEIAELPVREVILQEMLRTINTALSADNLMHSSLERIGEGSIRARRYLDLGLSFLSEGNISLASKLLLLNPLNQIHRLGWLVLQDIVFAETKLQKLVGDVFFGEIDDALRRKIKGRHPELSREDLQDLGSNTDTVLSPQAVFLLGCRITELFHLGIFFQKDLAASLHLADPPMQKSKDSVYQRLATGLFREAAGDKFRPAPVTDVEWPKLSRAFKERDFEKATSLVISKVPADAIKLFSKRLRELSKELLIQLKQSPGRIPDARYFRAILTSNSA